MKSWGIVLAGIALLLTGCATKEVKPSINPRVAGLHWQTRRRILQRITTYTIQGRVAASGSFGASGNLHWQQRGAHFSVQFSGPFGADAISISGRPGNVEIRSDGRRERTRTPETYLRRRYGWALPLRGLRYWVLGLPAPDTTAVVRYDSDGRVRRLFQDGWLIQYKNYQRAAGYTLPWHFQMHIAGTLFRIVIDRWKDVSPAAPKK